MQSSSLNQETICKLYPWPRRNQCAPMECHWVYQSSVGPMPRSSLSIQNEFNDIFVNFLFCFLHIFVLVFCLFVYIFIFVVFCVLCLLSLSFFLLKRDRKRRREKKNPENWVRRIWDEFGEGKTCSKYIA